MDYDVIIILIIAGFTVIAALALLFVLKSYLNEKKDLKKSQLAQCTEKVLGLATRFTYNVTERRHVVTVEYEVDSQKYQLQENVSKKSQLIKVGILTLDGKVKASTFVDVLYDPEDPQIAYLPENR